MGLSVMSAVNQGGAFERPPGLAQLEARKAEIAAELAKAVRAAVARKDTGHAAFHGCIDWHSAVHGAWALAAYWPHDRRQASDQALDRGAR